MDRTFLIVASLLVGSGCAVLDRGDPPAPDVVNPKPDSTTSDASGDAEEVSGDVSDSETPTVSFANDIHPYLMQTCTAVGCHSSGAGTFTLSGDVDADYAETLEEVVVGDALGSRLVKKASGVSSHTGGPLLQPGTEEYDLVVAWINGGAQP